MDPKTQRESTLICPKGNECSKAHTAIQLDLIPLATTIKNLSGVVKVQNNDLKHAKPSQPWKAAMGNVDLSGK